MTHFAFKMWLSKASIWDIQDAYRYNISDFTLSQELVLGYIVSNCGYSLKKNNNTGISDLKVYEEIKK